MNQFPLKNLVLKDRGWVFGFFFSDVLLCWVCFCLVFFCFVVFGFFKLYRETVAVVWGISGFLGFFPNMHAIEEALGYL